MNAKNVMQEQSQTQLQIRVRLVLRECIHTQEVRNVLDVLVQATDGYRALVFQIKVFASLSMTVFGNKFKCYVLAMHFPKRSKQACKVLKASRMFVRLN